MNIKKLNQSWKISIKFKQKLNKFIMNLNKNKKNFKY